MKLAARAKLNLYLAVGGKRPDGFHELVSVMQSVSLADTVSIAFHQPEFSLTCNVELGAAEQNIAAKAWRLLQQRLGLTGECALHLTKKIPVGAGLAGGSVDGAAVLLAANRELNLGLSAHELETMAAEIGSDVPFCIQGGTALVRGRGERVAPLAPLTKGVLVLVNGGEAVSTAQVFHQFDDLTPPSAPPVDTLLQALATGCFDNLENCFFNSLEAVAATLPEKQLARRETMKKLGLLPHLSGSGPTLFAYTDPETARAAQAQWPDALGNFYITQPEPSSLTILPD